MTMIQILAPSECRVDRGSGIPKKGHGLILISCLSNRLAVQKGQEMIESKLINLGAIGLKVE